MESTKPHPLAFLPRNFLALSEVKLVAVSQLTRFPVVLAAISLNLLGCFNNEAALLSLQLIAQLIRGRRFWGGLVSRTHVGR